MRIALVFNKRTNKSEPMTAVHYLDVLGADPTLEKDLVLTARSTGKPVILRGGYTHDGDERYVRPHFAHVAGKAPKQSHIFPPRKTETLKEAIQAGKRVLISLNAELSDVDMNFREDKKKGAVTIEDYRLAHGGQYHMVSVRNAQEAVDMIKRIVKIGGAGFKPSEKISTLHRGLVLPYAEFYMADKNAKMAAMYEAMHEAREGIVKGKERIMGAPRLFILKPTFTMIKEKGSKGIKGNSVKIRDGHMTCYGELKFRKADYKTTKEYRDLVELALSNPDGVYVLACPSITVGDDDNIDPAHDYAMIRWIVYDIDAQTSPAVRPGQPRPEAGRKAEGHVRKAGTSVPRSRPERVKAAKGQRSAGSQAEPGLFDHLRPD